MKIKDHVVYSKAKQNGWLGSEKVLDKLEQLKQENRKSGAMMMKYGKTMETFVHEKRST